MIPAYPLQWPSTIPRSPRREDGAFKTSLAAALDNVDGSLRRFAKDSNKPIREIVLSSNCTLGMNRPADPGVAAWFVWDGEQICIPVDRYNKPEANLQAIHHVIEARRVELRHGTLALVKASFRGFLALPGPASARPWRDVLETGHTNSLDEVKRNYRTLAAKSHPDRPGGSHEAMAALNAALQQAEQELRA